MKEIRSIIQQYDQIDHKTERVALASVVDVEASAYRRIGARMLVQSSGVWTGGISGGCLEGDALRRSQKAIFENKATTVVYDTMEDDSHQIGVGLGCNGRIEVLLSPIDPYDPNNEIETLRKIQHDTEPNIIVKIVAHKEPNLIGKNYLLNDEDITIPDVDHTSLKTQIEEVKTKKSARIYNYDNGDRLLIEFIRPEIHLVIAGDNYDVYAILGIANNLGWRCTILGKAKKLSKTVYQQTEKVLDYEDLTKVSINEYTAVILMSHDYKHDLNLLKKLTDSKAAYLGILGPKKRFVKLENEIGLDLSQHKFIHGPTGLEIGAESPEEIALSICSEIIAKMRNKPGGSLHLKKGAIHDDLNLHLPN